jgi:hypothetical protein
MPGIKHGIRHGSPPTISSCQAVSQIGRALTRWGPLTGYCQNDDPCRPAIPPCCRRDAGEVPSIRRRWVALRIITRMWPAAPLRRRGEDGVGVDGSISRSRPT